MMEDTEAAAVAVQMYQDAGTGVGVGVLVVEEHIYHSLVSASYYQKSALLFSAQRCS